MAAGRIATILAIAGLGIGLAHPVEAKRAQPRLPHLPRTDVPIPTPRPDPSAQTQAEADPAAAIAAAAAAHVEKARAAEPLRRGLDALAKGDAPGAAAARAALTPGSLDHEILSWAIALSGGASSRQMLEARSELSDWPGTAALQRNLERALYRENAAPEAVLSALGATPPTTYEGVVALARARLATDDTEGARKLVADYWRTAKLEAPQEAAFLKQFGTLLTRADHRFRMERMFYAERVNAGERAAKRAGTEQLAKAWGAMIREQREAGKLLQAVPAAQRDAGYHFAQAKYLRQRERFAEAAKVVLSAPAGPDLMADADAWWIERRVLSRELLDIGDVEAAYGIVAAHVAESPAMAADAEFHAGWYALTGLKDAARAMGHFKKITEIAGGPISLARAYYWMGRAAEAGAPGEPRDFYEQAARYGTAFYGQLAATELGRAVIATDYPTPTDDDRTRFAARQSVQAIDRLEAAGYGSRADILYRDLAGELTSPGELALLSARAERRGDHYLGLKVAKIAASRGLDIGALTHPMGAIPPSARISTAGKALAYAVARQESEFNAGAVSSAGARGLLQLLPRTARAMAKQVGLGYSASRLTTDPGYNASLGAAYLTEQLARFDGSYVLTFAGYNAGPARVQDWVRRYGDPRGKDVHAIVDWIERIPYAETRNYVQRVMENLQVYKMRLSGAVDIRDDLRK
jgi:soluble lytic murein transglycosylase